jgi:hypothetical protein
MVYEEEEESEKRSGVGVGVVVVEVKSSQVKVEEEVKVRTGRHLAILKGEGNLFPSCPPTGQQLSSAQHKFSYEFLKARVGPRQWSVRLGRDSCRVASCPLPSLVSAGGMSAGVLPFVQ